MKKKYFTREKTDIIYIRLNNELSLNYIPTLGDGLDYGLGEVCLEEMDDKFAFYIVDKFIKHDYEEFSNIEDAIDKLINFYNQYDAGCNPDIMKSIFYETLELKKEDKKLLQYSK